MSALTITFDAPQESIAILDEIADNLGADRETVLREAVATYLADYELLKAEVAEVDRQFEAGETLSHEEVVAKFNTWKSLRETREAA